MANATNIPETWLSLLDGYDAAGWLSAFAESPKEAVADLLMNSFYFGPLNLIERNELLEDWLDLLGNRESFAERLDAEFTSWIEENWGQYNRRAESLASTWSCLCGVIEFSAKLPADSRLAKSALALRMRLPESQKFLGSFSTAPSADPLGVYLAVIAEFQGRDRSLATFWHHMCDLPDGVPFYHAPFAMLGLRRLGAADPAEEGTLRAEVVLGLFRLARAFQRLIETRGLDAHIAKSTFQRVAANTAAAYPNSPGWVNHGLAEVEKLTNPAKEWIIEVIDPLADAIKRQKNKKTTDRPTRYDYHLRPQPDWTVRVSKITELIKRSDYKWLVEARRLLDEQSRYTEATGVTYYIVRTLSNLATRAKTLSPRLALHWAEEARRLDPDDPYTWNTLIALHVRQKHLTEALRLAWVAWKRFPEDSVTSRVLAEVLKVAQRYNESEAIYREAIERFPDVDVTRRGLAEVLKATRRYDEAAAIYQDAVYLFPDDVRSRNGLADTLRRMGKRFEAEKEYRRSIKSGYVDPATFVGLAYLVLHRGEAGRVEALELLDRALRLDPHEEYALSLKRELTKQGQKSLDELVNKWDKLADNVFDSLTFPTLGSAEIVAEPEEKEVKLEQPVSSAESRVRPVQQTEDAAKEDVQKSGSKKTTVEHKEKPLPVVEPSPKPEEVHTATPEEPTLIAEEQSVTEKPTVIAEEPTVTEEPTVAEEPTLIAEEQSIAEQSTVVAEEPTVTEAPALIAEEQSVAEQPTVVTEEPTVAEKPTLIAEEQSVAEEHPVVSEEPTAVEEPAVIAEEAGADFSISETQPHTVTIPDQLAVAALAAEAYFFRTWAKGAHDRLARARRKRVAELLARAEEMSPNDPAVLSEKIALSVDEGNKADGYKRLVTQLSTHPATTSLLVLKARMDRERAMEEDRKMSESALSELCAFPQRLRELDTTLAPLFHFQRGLAALALLDGNERKRVAAESFSRFRQTLAHRAKAEHKNREAARKEHEKLVPRFYEWLEEQVNRRVFAGVAEADDLDLHLEQIGQLEAVWDERRLLIEGIEDVFADRLTFRTM